MVDYDKTIKNFFKSVDAFLTGSVKKADDEREARAIIANQKNIRVIADGLPATASYVAQYTRQILPTYFGFAKRTSNNNTVNLAFIRVMKSIEDYYKKCATPGDSLDCAKAELLRCIKDWHYAISDNFFKDIVFAFKSTKSFAVKASNQKMK